MGPKLTVNLPGNLGTLEPEVRQKYQKYRLNILNRQTGRIGTLILYYMRPSVFLAPPHAGLQHVQDQPPGSTHMPLRQLGIGSATLGIPVLYMGVFEAPHYIPCMLGFAFFCFLIFWIVGVEYDQ